MDNETLKVGNESYFKIPAGFPFIGGFDVTNLQTGDVTSFKNWELTARWMQDNPNYSVWFPTKDIGKYADPAEITSFRHPTLLLEVEVTKLKTPPIKIEFPKITPLLTTSFILPKSTTLNIQPLKDFSASPDPVIAGIMQGTYNGKHFAPTTDNIQHYLNLYQTDKKVNEGWGDKQWGKVGEIMGAGALASGAIAAAAPVVGPTALRHLAIPTVLGETWNILEKNITGTNLSTEISKDLQNKGVNPFAADVIGGLTNPGYWVSPLAAGKYTGPVLNKLGIATTDILGRPLTGRALLNPTMQASINSIERNIAPSSFKTNVVNPIKNLPSTIVNKGIPKINSSIIQPTVNAYNKGLELFDKNMYKIERVLSPWQKNKSIKKIDSSTFPHFKFYNNADDFKTATKNNITTNTNEVPFLLTPSPRINKYLFGDAWKNLKIPKINMNYLGIDNADDALSAIASGAAATDVLLSDDRNPYVRALEIAVLARQLPKFLIQGRLIYNTRRAGNYFNNANEINKLIIKKLNIEFPPIYNRHIPKNIKHINKYHPTIDINKANFDNLVGYINSKNFLHKDKYSVSGNSIIDQNGTILFKRGANNEIIPVTKTTLKDLLETDINLFDYNTGRKYTGKITVGDDGSVVIPDEYTKILQGNVDYVLNKLFPGIKLKLFGSAAPVNEAGFPHATHDVDFYITRDELDKLFKQGMLSEANKVNPGTYRYELNKNEYGELGYIDLNVIDKAPNGMATGMRAEELYKQYFPEEYYAALRDWSARMDNNAKDKTFYINRSPEELFEMINPSSKTIMDSFDIDFLIPKKAKHKNRSWMHLVYSDPTTVSEGLHQYAKSILGSRVKLFPMSVDQLGNKELNLQALQKLGIELSDIELERIASDPQRMKNVLDAWYLMDNTAMRYIKGTWPTTGREISYPEHYIKSATTWIPKDNGGNGEGVGLNTTVGGDSQYSIGTKAFISPNTQYKSTNLLDLIDEVRYNFGGHPDAPSLLRTANGSLDPVSALLNIFDTRGWNFVQNGYKRGWGRYASATRPFDINSDFIGFGKDDAYLHPLVPRLKTKIPDVFDKKEIPRRRKKSMQERNSFKDVINSNKGHRYDLYIPYDYYNTNFSQLYGSIGLASIFPLTGGGVKYSIYRSERQDNENIKKGKALVGKSDEIIQAMPEELRKLYTQEGVNELFKIYKREYKDWPDEEIWNAIYRLLYFNYYNE